MSAQELPPGPLSLLFVSLRQPPFVRGGYEQLTSEVAEGLRARGHRVRILCGGGAGPSGPDLLPWLEPSLAPDRDLFAEVYRGGTRLAWQRHVRSRHNLEATRRALAAERTDLLVPFNLGLVSLAPIEAARAARVPVVAVVLDPWPANHWLREWRARGNKPLRLWLLRALIQRYQRSLGAWPMWVPSEFMRRELIAEGLAPERLERFRMGVPPLLPPVPPAPRSRRPGEPLRVLISSASWEGKGAHVVLEAAGRAVAKGVDLELYVAGDSPGAYRLELERLVSAHGLQARTRLLGRLPQERLFECASSCHVLAFPSLWGEPFARAPLEGLWLGLALLASDAGGTPELFVSGSQGLLLPAGEVPAWSEALVRMAQDEPYRMALAEAGQRLAVEHHSFASMLSALERRCFEAVRGGGSALAGHGA